MLLQAFGVSQASIDAVKVDLGVSSNSIVVTPTIQEAPVQIPTPIFGSTGIVNVPPPVVTPVTPKCDTTPVISVALDKQSINLDTEQSSSIYATTEVKDGCGTEYPYKIMTGNTPRGTNLSGSKSTAITGDNIWYWETMNHPEGNQPFPITISTATATNTQYIQVQ